MTDLLKKKIENYWENKDSINNENTPDLMNDIKSVLDLLNCGNIRIAEKINGDWQVNGWAQKAVLLYFKYSDSHMITASGMDQGHPGVKWYDKVPLKTYDWSEEDYINSGFRHVPNATVRYSAYLGKDVVLMPCYINVGAYVGASTMIDTWSTVGSCAQIGKNCHISGGVGIGGVLEPIGAKPVIIEDNCFIGARSEVAEGVIVEEGSVISMGVYLGASTKIVDRETGEIHYGRVPAYSVVVPGTLPPKNEGDPSLYCAVIVKKVDEKTRSKTSINEIYRTVHA